MERIKSEQDPKKKLVRSSSMPELPFESMGLGNHPKKTGKTTEEGVFKNMGKSKFIEGGVSEEEGKIIQDSIRSVANDEWVRSHFESVKCEPVIEILGVTLRKGYGSSSLKVSGDIYVKDSEDDKSGFIYLYQRSDGSEISDDGTLSLAWPGEGISAMAEPKIYLRIHDAYSTLVESVSLVEETSKLTHHNAEEYRTATVRGTDWSADVKYLGLMFGVFAYVVVQLESNGKEEQPIEVYGSISAEYKLSFSERRVQSITLFEITEESNASQSVEVGYVITMSKRSSITMSKGSSITMSRPVLACPAYSSLKINVDLKARKTKGVIVNGSANFQASNAHEYSVIHGSDRIHARVTCCWGESRMLRELHASETTVPLWIDNCLMSTSWKVPARNLVEVFSLFICLQNNKQLKLSGMVSFSNCDGYHILFRRDKDNPIILPSGCNLLPMEGPSYPLVPQEHFFVSVDLEDSKNEVSIKGFVHSDPRLDRQREPWYNRLLSCVIKGKNDCGFAVVHYTVFASALVASLKVHFFIKGAVSPPTRIHGSLTANYSDYGCKTPYERDFHRIVLFEREKENPKEISSYKSDLELIRHVLAVPYDSALQITADLTCVSSSGILIVIPIKERLQIRPGEKNVATQGDKIGICVDVEWGT